MKLSDKIKKYKENYKKPTPFKNRFISDILLIFFSSVSSAILANMDMVKEYFTYQQIKYFVISVIFLSAIIKILSNFTYEEEYDSNRRKENKERRD